MRPPSFARLLLPALLTACGAPGGGPPPGAAPPIGAVASAEEDGTRAGMAILAAGGNAVDAAVATALALAVVHPQAGNLGGGGFAVVRIDGDLAALDFRETAPAAARPDMFLDPSGAPMEDAALVGPLAAGVPGTPAGLHELHRRFGRLPWRALVEPAERLARDGFAVSRRLHDAIVQERRLLSRFPETRAVWLPGGEPPAPGAVIRLPELAGTLAAYAAGGSPAITRGGVARAVERAARAHGGVLTEADLAAYTPVWRRPLRFEALGWSVAGMPLPSSGGLLLAQTFGLLERLEVASAPRGSAARLHLLAETWRRAYADRFLLGDPDRLGFDPAALLEPAWIAERAASIDRRRATPSAAVRPWPGAAARERAATTHLSVAAGGGFVALTTTLNGWFGCGLHVPGAGFLLNNEMDDFATAPGRPNMFGLVQGRNNAVAPGARMLSSMSPTIAWRGADTLVLGAPGGSRIPTATAQVFLAVALDGLALMPAVEARRIHHQWLPDEIAYESGALSPAARAGLERLGHSLRPAPWPIGQVNAVRRHADGRFEAAADPRGPGAAAVLEAPAAGGHAPAGKAASGGP
jgi:gamma-glutamyltranspeptidase/glutathione hydrolase